MLLAKGWDQTTQAAIPVWKALEFLVRGNTTCKTFLLNTVPAQVARRCIRKGEWPLGKRWRKARMAAGCLPLQETRGGTTLALPLFLSEARALCLLAITYFFCLMSRACDRNVGARNWRFGGDPLLRVASYKHTSWKRKKILECLQPCKITVRDVFTADRGRRMPLQLLKCPHVDCSKVY